MLLVVIVTPLESSTPALAAKRRKVCTSSADRAVVLQVAIKKSWLQCFHVTFWYRLGSLRTSTEGVPKRYQVPASYQRKTKKTEWSRVELVPGSGKASTKSCSQNTHCQVFDVQLQLLLQLGEQLRMKQL